MCELKDRILNDIRINKETECWEWQKAKRNSDGYGTTTYLGITYSVHRLSYELFVSEIPPNKQILHSCDNPCCCNPIHLRIGTNYDNVQDRQKRNRQAKGITHGRHKLTEEEIISIRNLYATGKYIQQDIADEFNVSRSHICNILKNKFWKHIT